MTASSGNRTRAALGAATVALAALLGAAVSGCADTTKVYVQSSDKTNAGKVLHMMVRSVDAKAATAAESYQEVAAKLFAPAKDESIVSTQPVFPGRLTTITLERPTDKTLVLYFFFTTPGDNWHVQLGTPLPPEVYVDLGQDQIDRVQVRR